MSNYMFHGGCSGCNNSISICPLCKYMESNWTLPDKNPVNIEKANIQKEMIQKAKAAYSSEKLKQ